MGTSRNAAHHNLRYRPVDEIRLLIRLSSPEYLSLGDYLHSLGIAGLFYQVFSLNFQWLDLKWSSDYRAHLRNETLVLKYGHRDENTAIGSSSTSASQ